jgi:hypothetical protein
MAVKYNNTSNYSKTSLNKKYLSILTRETLSTETKSIQIESKYDRRPDLLANDLYGNSRVWWVFAHYNREKLKDPLNDFRAGMTIIVPKKFKVSG